MIAAPKSFIIYLQTKKMNKHWIEHPSEMTALKYFDVLQKISSELCMEKRYLRERCSKYIGMFSWEQPHWKDCHKYSLLM